MLKKKQQKKNIQVYNKIEYIAWEDFFDSLIFSKPWEPNTDI